MASERPHRYDRIQSIRPRRACMLVAATRGLSIGAALLLTLPVGACRPPSSASSAPLRATVRIDGSPAVKPLAVALARDFNEANPGTLIVLGAGMGSVARLEALADGRIDIALASHGVDSIALAMRGLVAHEFARSAVVFAVNQAAGVHAIESRQLCNVYAGTVERWTTLGGADLAVVPLVRPEGEVDADVVLAGIPCFRAASGAVGVRTIERPEDMASLIASMPGAVGMTSMPFVVRSLRALRPLSLDGVMPDAASVRSGRYPLVRRSYFVTRAEPTPVVQRFLAFVRSDRGSHAVEASGAVSVP